LPQWVWPGGWRCVPRYVLLRVVRLRCLLLLLLLRLMGGMWASPVRLRGRSVSSCCVRAVRACLPRSCSRSASTSLYHWSGTRSCQPASSHSCAERSPNLVRRVSAHPPPPSTALFHWLAHSPAHPRAPALARSPPSSTSVSSRHARMHTRSQTRVASRASRAATMPAAFAWHARRVLSQCVPTSIAIAAICAASSARDCAPGRFLVATFVHASGCALPPAWQTAWAVVCRV
jgi:hypothetical protein